MTCQRVMEHNPINIGSYPMTCQRVMEHSPINIGSDPMTCQCVMEHNPINIGCDPIMSTEEPQLIMFGGIQYYISFNF